ncbi:Hypothetical predicted protein [Octopus vulgaris]|uniref:Uncharacterized protein n=1 Tax=Octopus vulgaris TaxID=6645 RepID=A0AA36BC28_OCTVU|nr:Hypothetical predicted protein [Octopus vulgaris]
MSAPTRPKYCIIQVQAQYTVTTFTKHLFSLVGCETKVAAQQKTAKMSKARHIFQERIETDILKGMIDRISSAWTLGRTKVCEILNTMDGISADVGDGSFLIPINEFNFTRINK